MQPRVPLSENLYGHLVSASIKNGLADPLVVKRKSVVLCGIGKSRSLFRREAHVQVLLDPELA